MLNRKHLLVIGALALANTYCVAIPAGAPRGGSATPRALAFYTANRSSLPSVALNHSNGSQYEGRFMCATNSTGNPVNIIVIELAAGGTRLPWLNNAAIIIPRGNSAASVTVISKDALGNYTNPSSSNIASASLDNNPSYNSLKISGRPGETLSYPSFQDVVNAAPVA